MVFEAGWRTWQAQRQQLHYLDGARCGERTITPEGQQVKLIGIKRDVLLCYFVSCLGLNCLAHEKPNPSRLSGSGGFTPFDPIYIAGPKFGTTREDMLEKTNLVMLIQSSDENNFLQAVRIEEEHPGTIRSILENGDQFALEYWDYRKLVFALSKASNAEEELF